MRLTIATFIAVLFCGTAQACPILFDIRGQTVVTSQFVAGDQLGFNASAIGDFDGDGFPDFATAARRDLTASHEGSVHVFSGRTGRRVASFRSPNNSDFFGRALVGLGDINGDGRADFAASLESIPFLGTERGSILVYSAGSTAPVGTLTGEPGEHFARSAISPGDLDGDGVPDLVVGVPEGGEPSPYGGLIQVFSGRTLQLLNTFSNPYEDITYLGEQLRTVGDLDGDGFGDVAAIGDSATYGDYLLILSGRALALGLSPHIVGVSGADGGFSFGKNAGALGDIDGDGRNEFLWTIEDNRGEQSISRVYVARLDSSGIFILYAADGDAGREGFGRSMASIPDINGDGRTDFVVVWSGTSSFLSTGAFYVFSGADGARLYTEPFSESFVGLGNHVAHLGDVNGDGLPEIVLGNNFENRGQNLTGYNGSQILQEPEGGAVLVRSVGLDSNGNGKPDACENSAGNNPNTPPGGGSGDPSGLLLVDQGLAQGNMVFTFRVQLGGQLVSLPASCSYNLRMGATKRRKGSLKAPVVSIPATGNPLTVSIGGGLPLSNKSLGRKFLRYEAQLSCPGVATTQFKKASGRIRATTSRNGGLSLSKWLAVVRDLLGRG